MKAVRMLSAALLILSASWAWGAPAPFIKPAGDVGRARLIGTWFARWDVKAGERRAVFSLHADGNAVFTAEGAGGKVVVKGKWRFQGTGGKGLTLFLNDGTREGQWSCRWATPLEGDDPRPGRPFELNERGKTVTFKRFC